MYNDKKTETTMTVEGKRVTVFTLSVMTIVVLSPYLWAGFEWNAPYSRVFGVVDCTAVLLCMVSASLIVRVWVRQWLRERERRRDAARRKRIESINPNFNR